MKNKILRLFSFTLLLLPSISFAQNWNLGSNTFQTLIYEIIGLIEILLPILTALAFIMFFWGLSKFILAADNQANIEKGRNYMLWGILAIFVLLSFQAIIFFISGELDINTGNGGIPFLRTS